MLKLIIILFATYLRITPGVYFADLLIFIYLTRQFLGSPPPISPETSFFLKAFAVSILGFFISFFYTEITGQRLFEPFPALLYYSLFAFKLVFYSFFLKALFLRKPKLIVPLIYALSFPVFISFISFFNPSLNQFFLSINGFYDDTGVLLAGDAGRYGGIYGPQVNSYGAHALQVLIANLILLRLRNNLFNRLAQYVFIFCGAAGCFLSGSRTTIVLLFASLIIYLASISWYALKNLRFRIRIGIFSKSMILFLALATILMGFIRYTLHSSASEVSIYFQQLTDRWFDIQLHTRDITLGQGEEYSTINVLSSAFVQYYSDSLLPILTGTLTGAGIDSLLFGMINVLGLPATSMISFYIIKGFNALSSSTRATFFGKTLYAILIAGFLFSSLKSRAPAGNANVLLLLILISPYLYSEMFILHSNSKESLDNPGNCPRQGLRLMPPS